MTQLKPAASDIVAKLWNLCNLLRDDGVTYHQYVTELTYLLFLKMMQETKQEERLIIHVPQTDDHPAYDKSGITWINLVEASDEKRLDLYETLLRDYGHFGKGIIRQIYANAVSIITKPVTLSKLIVEINKLQWYSVDREDLGDLYEGLLERNALEKKSGAGQYFTPRDLIDSIVAIMRPEFDDVIQDPAAGTGGFLISAHHYLSNKSEFDSLSEAQKKRYSNATFHGMELVQDTHRLALMNLLLHGIEGGIQFGDTLGQEGTSLVPATLVLSNPPFGTKKGGGLPTRSDLPYPTTNKQFCFLQHIYLSLKPGGRAAVVLPDNVLFESNIGTDIRRDLMDKCNLHTILRLPPGIFYAQGVKTNVLFFTRGKTDKGNTKEVWIYDMRTNMPLFGKRTRFSRNYFQTLPDTPSDIPRDKFEDVFGDDPNGGPEALANRKDTGENGRWRKFTREYISARNDSLDISWLKDNSLEALKANGDQPAMIARLALHELNAAVLELRTLLDELGEDPDLELEEILIIEDESGDE